jgi:hypothetical protein
MERTVEARCKDRVREITTEKIAYKSGTVKSNF